MNFDPRGRRTYSIYSYVWDGIHPFVPLIDTQEQGHENNGIFERKYL